MVASSGTKLSWNNFRRCLLTLNTLSIHALLISIAPRGKILVTTKGQIHFDQSFLTIILRRELDNKTFWPTENYFLEIILS